MKRKILFTLAGIVLSTLLHAQNGSVCGSIYNDINSNNVLDTDETGLQGISIFMFLAPASEDFTSATTDANGNYCFTGLEDGQYGFYVSVPDGYTTSNGSNQFIIDIMGSSANTYSFGLRSSMSAPQYAKEGFSIYQSGQDVITVISQNNGIGQISLYNLAGQKVLVGPLVNEEIAVDVSSLAQGIYVAQFTAGNKQAFTKIVVE